MTESFVNSGNALLWACEQGSGVPLLLCNGGPGCCDYLEPVAAMVDDLARVIRFEQRGCGRSSLTRPYDLETCIEDMEAIRRHYGIDTWIVGGHSWGPDLALAYALAHPSSVLGIIGISGGVVHKDEQWREQYHRLKGTSAGELPEFRFPPNMDVNQEVSDSWKAFVRRPNLLREIADLQVSALFVYGENDIRPSWPVEQLAQLLPNGRFVLIEGAPHIIWVSHQEQLRESLRAFIMTVVREMKVDNEILA